MDSDRQHQESQLLRRRETRVGISPHRPRDGSRKSTNFMIVPIYFFLERALTWIHNGATALIQGLSLGLLSNEKLERITEQRYLRQSVCSSE